MHSYSVPCRCYVRALECAMQCTKPEISAWSIQMAECQIVHLSICPDRISPRSDSKIPQIRSRKNSHSHSHSAHAVLRSPFSDCCSAEAHCAVRAPQPPQKTAENGQRRFTARFDDTLRRHAFPAVFCLRCLRPPRPGRTWHSACCCCCCCRCCCCCCPLRFAVAVSPRSSQHYITSTARPASPRLGVWAIICNVHLHSLLSADIFTYQSTTPQSLLCNISLQYL